MSMGHSGNKKTLLTLQHRQRELLRIKKRREGLGRRLAGYTPDTDVPILVLPFLSATKIEKDGKSLRCEKTVCLFSLAT